MFECLLLTAAITVGQSGSPAPAASTAPVARPALGFEADDPPLLPPAPSAWAVPLARPAPGLKANDPPLLPAPPSPYAHPPRATTPAPVQPVSYPGTATALATDQPPTAAPPAPVEVTAPLLPPPAAPATPPAPAAPATPPATRYLFMEAMQGSWVGNGLYDSRMQIWGWTEGSYTAGSVGRGAWPMLAQSPTDDFLMNQNWLVFERTIIPSGTTPTVGFHTAWILPGSDARYTVSNHMFNRQDGVFDLTKSDYPIDLFHAYAEIFIPTVAQGLDIKIGKNAVPFFVETEDKVNNPLFSHTYIFYDGGPFTFTGLQANLKLNNAWAVEGRLVLGNDMFIGPGDLPTFVGAVQWTQPGGGRNTALLSVVLGSDRFDTRENPQNFQTHYNLIDLVYTHTFNPVLKYSLDAVAGYETNISTIAPKGADTAAWYGVAQYLTYTLSPRLSTTGRLEFFDDAQGVRTGFTGLYTEATAGVTFKPRYYVWFRPEVRYDYNFDSRPFGDHRQQLSLASDLILRW